VHGAHLVCGQRLAEQIDGGHLTAEHPLLVQLGGGSDVAFVEWLQPPTHALLAITQTLPTSVDGVGIWRKEFSQGIRRLSEIELTFGQVGCVVFVTEKRSTYLVGRHEPRHFRARC
jgi:hypothetical protein